MNAQIFREYDIRGIIGDEIAIEEFATVAYAITTYLRQQKPTLAKIVVGRDGRTHSSAIHRLMINTIQSLGLNVIDIGMTSTPILYFTLAQDTTLDAGLMITASHNPGEYNGIKTCLGSQSLWGESIMNIGQIALHQNYVSPPTRTDATITSHNATSNYLDWLYAHFTDLHNVTLPLVIDCGNGATGPVIEQLVDRFGWQQATLLFADIDGTFPNHEPDPTSLKNMQALAQALQQYPENVVGIGFDGDGDRMSAMLPSGQLIASDQLLALFAQDIAPGKKPCPVVSDIKCSCSVIDYITNLGCSLLLSPCGHAIIKQTMQQHNALLAGELSGHFFFADDYFGYDDGVYAMMRLLRLLNSNRSILQETLSALPTTVSSPEIRIPCPDEVKKEVVAHAIQELEKQNIELLLVDGLRATFDNGWGLLRASNTQPAVSLRFEASSDESLTDIKQLFARLLAPYIEKETVIRYLEL